MSYLLEILGRGLLAELSAAFRDVLHDDGHFSTEELRTARQRRPDDPEPCVRLGQRHLAQRDYASAQTAFEAALKIEPDNLAARVGAACAADELGRTNEVAHHLQLARRYHENDATVLFASGFCHEKWGQVEPAIDAYTACLEVADNLRNAHERLAAIYLKRNQLDLAIEHYEQVCWHEPGEIVACLILATSTCKPVDPTRPSVATSSL